MQISALPIRIAALLVVAGAAACVSSETEDNNNSVDAAVGQSDADPLKITDAGDIDATVFLSDATIGDPVCGNGNCETGETALSCASDCTASCTSYDGKFAVNGGTAVPMLTVNTGLTAGTILITMDCSDATQFSWGVQSGGCISGQSLNGGRNYTCDLASGTNVTFTILNQNVPNVIAHRTFVAN